MKKNEHEIDSVFRIVVGLVLISLVFVGPASYSLSYFLVLPVSILINKLHRSGTELCFKTIFEIEPYTL